MLPNNLASQALNPTSFVYTASRQTVTALPGHGLVDTGAQEGVCGLWHFRRWVCGLGKLFGLRPAFLPLNEGDRTGGVGGAARVVARCDMPTGIAGVNGLTRWMILDDPEGEKIPRVFRTLFSFNSMRG